LEASWGASLERSSLVEAIEQLTRALAQIETYEFAGATQQSNQLQVALFPPVSMVKVFAGSAESNALQSVPFTIEHSEALGEPSKTLSCSSQFCRRLRRQLVGFKTRRAARACGAFPGTRREPGATSAALLPGNSMMGVCLWLRRWLMCA